MLPEDIIIDIHTRLPVKSIGRFRCVLKRWRSLLPKPKFIKDHLTRNKQYPVEESLILVPVKTKFQYTIPMSSFFQLFDECFLSVFKFNFAVHHDFYMEDIPSCDGLILIRDSNDRRVFINPTTREVRELPTSPYALPPPSIDAIYAVGYDSVSDDYKVVTLSYYWNDSEHDPYCTRMFVSVYSLRHGAWKNVEAWSCDHSGIYSSYGIFHSGCIHWLADQVEDNSPSIVRFDLAEEKFSEMKAPGKFSRLMVLGGCLCLFDNLSLWSSTESEVWVMMDYGVYESWIKITITDFEKADYTPLCMSGKGKMLMLKDEGTDCQKLIMYNLKDGTFLDNIKVIDIIIKDSYVGGTYVETIVSPFYNNATGGD